MLLYFPSTPNLTLTPQFILFPDGTQQTSGNVVSIDTEQTITGVKTFSNYVTIGSQNSVNVTYTGTVKYTTYNPYTSLSGAGYNYYQYLTNGSFNYTGPPLILYYVIQHVDLKTLKPSWFIRYKEIIDPQTIRDKKIDYLTNGT